MGNPNLIKRQPNFGYMLNLEDPFDQITCNQTARFHSFLL